MIVSCLEILAILDYFISQRQEEALSHTRIFQQASTAADILGWSELLPDIPPYRTYIEQTIIRLQHLYRQRPQPLMESTVDALRQLLSMVDRYMMESHIQDPRVAAIDTTPALRQSIRLPSDCQHIYSSMELVQHDSLDRHSDYQEDNALGKNILEAQVAMDFDHDGVSRSANQLSWNIMSHAGPNYKYKGGAWPLHNRNGFKIQAYASTGQDQNSLTLIDTKSAATQIWPCYPASSRASVSSTFDQSCSASDRTPSASSEYSPKVSQSTSPITDQERLYEHEAGTQSLDCRDQEFSDGQQIWTCNYV